MFENIRIVLVETSHPGNIGGAARAMKNMGLNRLYLVNPVQFPSGRATARASGACDVLQNAVVCETFDEAVSDANLLIGTSARMRTLPIELLNPRKAVSLALDSSDQEIAIIFGREKTGLNNEELIKCHYHVNIPTEENFSSLNLAAAVQVLCYEFRMAALMRAGDEFFCSENIVAAKIEKSQDDFNEDLGNEAFATQAEVQGFIDHIEATMTATKFLNPEHPKMLMQRVHRLYNRTRLTKTEVNILRGMLSSISKC